MDIEDKELEELDNFYSNSSIDKIADAFSEPFESENLSESMFKAAPSVFDDKYFGNFNRTVAGGAVDALDLGLRTIESGVKGGATAINEAKNYITGQKDDRLKRDMLAFFESMGTGGATSGPMKLRQGINQLIKSGKTDEAAKVILAESDAFKGNNFKEVLAMTAKREPSPVRQLKSETIEQFKFPINQSSFLLDGDTVTIYHGTSKSTLPNILKSGLKGDKEGKVYTSPDVHSATGYGSVVGGEKANIRARRPKQNIDNENRLTLKYEIPKEDFLKLIGDAEKTQRSISSRMKLFREDSKDLFEKTKDNPQFYSKGKPQMRSGNYYEGTEIRFNEGDIDKYLVGTVQRVPKSAVKEVPPLNIGASKYALDGNLKSNYTTETIKSFDDKLKNIKTAGSSDANKLIGVEVKDGTKVGIRKNLNSSTIDGEKGVLQTIHTDNYNGKALSYQPYATVENVTFNVNQKHRQRIASRAKGLAVPEASGKFNMASVDGTYVSNRNLLKEGYDTEISFNPALGHLYTDVATGQAVKSADTATVIGNRVFANGVTYWKRVDAPKPLDASDGTKLIGEVRYKFKRGGLMARA